MRDERGTSVVGSGAAQAAPPAIDVDARFRLSKHMQIRPRAPGFVAESLITGRRQALPNAASVRLLLSLCEPTTLRDVLSRMPRHEPSFLLEFFAGCYERGLITHVAQDGTAEEDALGALLHWEPHDLAFHLWSRRGRNPALTGATGHLVDVVPAEPLRRISSGVASLALPTPDLVRLETEDWSLTRALETRRSRYEVGSVPLASLAELLFRACRVSRVTTDGEALAQKVYPSGGSLHSLEVYVLAHRCAGLPSGGYRYDAFEHRLERLAAPGEDLEQLLREAQVGTGRLPDLPSVLLIFAARFRRVSRKYQSIAYHLILQEVGALYQTLYLVAETLGIAACAIGAGDSDRFARAFGTDFFMESSVGEMILGGREG